MDDTKGSHLSVVVDLSPVQWHLAGQDANPLMLETFLTHFLTFLNSHVASKHENSLAVFGAFPGKSVMLYSSTDAQDTRSTADSNSYLPFKTVDSTVVSKIMAELEELEAEDERLPSAIVSALTKALCYVNRLTIESNARSSQSSMSKPSDIVETGVPLHDARILVLSVSPDQTESYVPIMNSIFSAQKLRITIDACQMYGPETVFFQQAAHLTGGSYVCLEKREALLQYLIMSFLSPPSIRRIIGAPTQEKIDFRAACFCHKNIVDIGFVCSVCLSIFCAPVPICSTCRTRFPIKTLQRLNASRPSTGRASAAPTRASSMSLPGSAPGTPSALRRPPINGQQNGS